MWNFTLFVHAITKKLEWKTKLCAYQWNSVSTKIESDCLNYHIFSFLECAFENCFQIVWGASYRT